MTDPVPPLLDRLRVGDAAALGELFDLYRDRLGRLLAVRLDGRLARRVAAEDVVQETFLDARRRIGEYLADPAVPVYVWLRFLAVQRLQMLRRAHLGAKARDASLEVAWPEEGLPAASADSLVGVLAGRLTSPSRAAARHELQDRLRAALDALEPLDREVLALRHFEELGNNETAAVLGLSKDAASKRYVRALQKLKAVLGPE